ncbi:MAG: FtsH protease activity modulator HflK [Myxococcota bacterium]|nr:FtsH protease activity modulator HflK [Myxococcota bacterium]
MERSPLKIVGYSLGLLFAGWLVSSCVFFVDTKEVGIVYHWGKWSRTLPAGVHLTLPYPIEKVERLAIINTRNIDIKMPRLLTGDANLLDAHLVVQYDIAQEKDYVLAHSDADELLQALLQSILIRVVGHSQIDRESFVNRNLLERQIRQVAQKEIDRINLGISLRSVGFQELSAPKAVIDAFNEISSARGEKDTMILSAQSYASKALPSARGEAKKKIEEAHAYGAQIRNQAKIRCERFTQLLDIWEKNPNMLRANLRSQTWAAIQDQVTVHYVSDGDHLILPPTKETDREP